MNISLSRDFKMFFLCICTLVLSCSDQDDRIDLLQIKEYTGRTQDFSIWQLEQFFGEVQMAYILKTDEGNIIVVDGGLQKSAGYLEDYIEQLGGKVHTWLTTHPHKDHIGALSKIIRNNRIEIERIIHTSLDLDKIRLHEPISFELVRDYYSVLKNSKIEIQDATFGNIFSLGDGIDLQILGSRNDNILVNLINNSSLVFKISSKSKSVLFLGDLGVEGGRVILNNGFDKDLRANYVQMAHHGQDGVDKAFYKVVDAQYAFWPTPTWLWENNLDAKGYNSGNWKTLEVRNWMKDINIKENFVSGIEGTIQID
jgi:hypothetical protein